MHKHPMNAIDIATKFIKEYNTEPVVPFKEGDFLVWKSEYHRNCALPHMDDIVVYHRTIPPNNRTDTMDDFLGFVVGCHGGVPDLRGFAFESGRFRLATQAELDAIKAKPYCGCQEEKSSDSDEAHTCH